MKRKEILVLSIGVFMTIAVWVSIELYRTNTIDVRGDINLPQIQRHEIDLSVIEKLRNKTP
jgi:hypothetical protein